MDVKWLEDMGVTKGNLLSIAVTLLTGGGIMLGAAWSARGVLDQLEHNNAMLEQRMAVEENELHRIDAARQDGQKALYDVINHLNNRMDQLYNEGRHGEVPREGDITVAPG